MALKKQYEPCPMHWMEMENPRFTICEVLREIYKESSEDHVKFKARIAMTMAKSMNTKLMEYNKDWNPGIWDGDTNSMKKQITEDREKQNGGGAVLQV
ncbi:MAG TPA: hypothetical protein DCY35_04630 [Prolixibacteraceae bacterium]|jgi:hypothetical protein|nr:hypothetical protein [Prolixibacteraceae bacterium]